MLDWGGKLQIVTNAATSSTYLWGGKLCLPQRAQLASEGSSAASAKRSLAAQTGLNNAGDWVATEVCKLMGTPEIVVCTGARCSAQMVRALAVVPFEGMK